MDNVELYYAIVNILDWYTKVDRSTESGTEYTPESTRIIVKRILHELNKLDKDNSPQVVGEANDCGCECETWNDVIVGFRELWANGERK